MKSTWLQTRTVKVNLSHGLSNIPWDYGTHVVQCSTKLPKGPFRMPSKGRGTSTKTSSMLNKHGVCWIDSLAIKSALYSGDACNQVPAPDGCSQLHSALSATVRPKSAHLCQRNTGVLPLY